MVKTFDTSRVGGGTYELEQGSDGNYKLKPVGFDKVNKLNLPDLTNLDLPATTTTVKTEEKKDVADPFKKLASQQDGGGDNNQDYSGVTLKTPKVKDVSVRSAGDPAVKIDTGKTDDPRGFLASGAAGGASLQGDKASDPFLASGAAGGARLPSQVREQKPGMLSTPQQQQQTFAARTTGLQKVTSKATGLKNALSKSVAFNAVKGVAQGLGAFLGAILPEETESQIHARGYFNINPTSNQPQRIAGNPTENVFAGAHRNSRDLNKVAQKRIDMIEKNLAAGKYKDPNEKRERLKKFKDQQKDYNNNRVSKREDKSGKGKKSGFTNPGKGSYGPHSGGGNGDPGCFIRGTLITMLDGSKKPVEKIDLGDNVAIGGKVFAVGRFLNTELYDYKSIKVSGSHMVNEDGTWLRVRDTKHGKSLGDDLNTVYVFGSENRRILIDDILFTDYFEVSEQDQLINNEEDFFNNWKSYGNTIDEHNVNTLNAS